MNLPVVPPVRPMLGKLADGLPAGEGWWFEPKWDGFRALVFRDGDDLQVRSRDNKPLLRYFPELHDPLCSALPERCVVDGEIVIARRGRLEFDTLQMRLHPAKSRIDKLAAEIPASIVLWDVLAQGDEDLRDRPLVERRALLEDCVTQGTTVRLTPGTMDRAVAEDWFQRFEGAGFDGVMAKRPDDPYAEGKRGLVKVKHVRTIDAAVAGFRWHKHGQGVEVGSLVLALFDDEGALHPIGVCASFSKKRRAELVEELAPLRENASQDHPWANWGAEAEHRPDVRSRWAAGRSLNWEPLRLERVAEVRTTQNSGRRLRHPAKWTRWRTDKAPQDCTMEQLRIVPAAELGALSVRVLEGAELVARMAGKPVHPMRRLYDWCTFEVGLPVSAHAPPAEGLDGFHSPRRRLALLLMGIPIPAAYVEWVSPDGRALAIFQADMVFLQSHLSDGTAVVTWPADKFGRQLAAQSSDGVRLGRRGRGDLATDVEEHLGWLDELEEEGRSAARWSTIPDRDRMAGLYDKHCCSLRTATSVVFTNAVSAVLFVFFVVTIVWG